MKGQILNAKGEMVFDTEKPLSPPSFKILDLIAKSKKETRKLWKYCTVETFTDHDTLAEITRILIQYYVNSPPQKLFYKTVLRRTKASPKPLSEKEIIKHAKQMCKEFLAQMKKQKKQWFLTKLVPPGYKFSTLSRQKGEKQ